MSGPASNGPARIVVGVDGSEGSKRALRWAARQAGLTGAVVEAVIAWHFPAFLSWAPATPADDYDIAGIARQVLTQTLREVFGSTPPARLRTRVVEGHPAQVLMEASDGAELLVVGSRGYGGFADALLGSVSTYCVHHAQCPLTIIRPPGLTAPGNGVG
jgi:nucleotide-binding universal stress UspA family protein